jgi:hypothetical protein
MIVHEDLEIETGAVVIETIAVQEVSGVWQD